MAKKKRKKKKRTSEKQVSLPEPVGWRFWIIAFVLLFGPMTYAAYLISEEDRRATLLPWILGFSSAAIIAGVLSAGTNSILDWRSRHLIKKRKRSKA